MDSTSTTTSFLEDSAPSSKDHQEENMKGPKLSIQEPMTESWFGMAAEHPARIMGIMSMMPFLFQSHHHSNQNLHHHPSQTITINHEPTKNHHQPTNFSIESILNWSRSTSATQMNKTNDEQLQSQRSQSPKTYLLKPPIDANDTEQFYKFFQHYSTNESEEDQRLIKLKTIDLTTTKRSSTSSTTNRGSKILSSSLKRRPVNRGPRIPFTPSQVQELESKFNKTQYLSSMEVSQLAKRLNLSDTRVRIWFQNRRAREKRENRTENTPEDLDQKKSPKNFMEINENDCLMNTTTELSVGSSPSDSNFDADVGSILMEESSSDNQDDEDSSSNNN